ncbi:MAG TPA: polyprenol monophosphomannose synthase [Phototrophicaceae bacterium]|nr:polyprenol monophosphomannose synthase [Phototrophicaceae bacterium]
MPKTVVVIPTYNELENLPLITQALFELNINDLQILIVDDNSPDGTGKLADELALNTYPGRLSVLHRTQKAGLGPAYIAGFKEALHLGADYIIQMDADFSHQPKYLLDLLKAIETHDLVIASRFVKGGSVDENWSFYRKLLSWFANRVYTPLILGIRVYDATAGFRIWRRQTLIGLDLDRIRSNGYVFQVEMAYVASRLGFRVGEIPIYFPDRKLGQSKMDIRIQIEAAMRVWQVMLRHRALNPQNRRTQAYSG